MPTDSSDRLRTASATDLEQAGQRSLREHLHAQALVAHQKYAPLTVDRIDELLHDPNCLRHPTRIVFEFGGMALHQFAQPDLDGPNRERDGRVLYLRPVLRAHPDLILLAVAYMIPVINYGDLIADEHCRLYGATLLGLFEDEFYQRICALADFAGAQVQLP